MRWLLHWDHVLFRLINLRWHNEFFDWIMPFLRNSTFWVPVYFFLVLFGLVNYKQTGWWWVIYAVCTGMVTNFISSALIKENIIRLRPCNDPALAGWIRVLVGGRPHSSSFTSSHAANHFGLSMFLHITLRDQIGKWTILFFLWALSICYAQIYVGVHYPLDAVGGSIVGILVGYLASRSFNKNFGLA